MNRRDEDRCESLERHGQARCEPRGVGGACTPKSISRPEDLAAGRGQGEVYER